MEGSELMNSHTVLERGGNVVCTPFRPSPLISARRVLGCCHSPDLSPVTRMIW